MRYNQAKLVDMSIVTQAVKRKILRAYGDRLDSNDVRQMLEICDLLPVDHISSDSPEIEIDSPLFGSSIEQYEKTEELLNCTDFLRKYDYFMRLVYCLLKLKVPIFEENNACIVFIDNYRLMRSIEKTKQALIKAHILVLNAEYKNPKSSLTNDYENYSDHFIKTVRQLDRVRQTMAKLIDQQIWTNGDTLMSLVLPYLYRYVKIVEIFGD